MPQAGLLGRNAPLPRDTNPRLIVEDYVDFAYRTSVLPRPSANVSRLVPSWPMYLNDQLGDCTEAAKGHAIQVFTSFGKQVPELTVTNSKVEKWYERDGGYVPGDPSTDQGCVVQDVLTNWQKDDSSVCPITEFAELKNFYTISNVKEALYLFGTVYIGFNFPSSAMDQFNAGQPWEYVPGSQIDGGHAVIVQEIYQPGINDMIEVVTWGTTQRMNLEFWNHYVEEVWVMISPDWFNSSGVDTDGFNLSQLQADFSQLA